MGRTRVVEVFGPLLQLLARSSPWIALVTTVIGATYLAWRELRRNTWHFSEQCSQRFADLQKRLDEERTLRREWQARSDRWESVATNTTETAVRSVAISEKLTAAVVRPAQPEAAAE